MQTVTGKQFWPIDPRPEEIDIRDIAGALARLCRYGGQLRSDVPFYSVAEHCVHVADHAPEGLQLTALLHDASEAYLCDIIRPIKPFLSNYYEIEERLERAVAVRFGLSYPWAPEVKRLDTAILADERDQAMAPPPVPWSQTTEPPLGVTLQFWTPEESRDKFLHRFYFYGGR